MSENLQALVRRWRDEARAARQHMRHACCEDRAMDSAIAVVLDDCADALERVAGAEPPPFTREVGKLETWPLIERVQQMRRYAAETFAARSDPSGLIEFLLADVESALMAAGPPTCSTEVRQMLWRAHDWDFEPPPPPPPTPPMPPSPTVGGGMAGQELRDKARCAEWDAFVNRLLRNHATTPEATGEASPVDTAKRLVDEGRS